jgi:putative transposase
MLLTHQYKLNPTEAQSALMAEWGELLRRHWNYALGQRLDALRRSRCQVDRCSIVSEPIGEISGRVNYYTQASQLKETKRLFPKYTGIYADCQQQNLMRLDKAWKKWLTPDKAGKRGGRPRFKKRGDLCSFTFPRVNVAKAGAKLMGTTLKLSRIGEIPVILHRPIPDGFKLKQATILYKADGWYVSFALEDGTVPEILPVEQVVRTVGIDVGLEKFLATSDGEAVAIPQFFRQSQQQLARQQKKLSRMVKGSANYRRQANKVARLHLHVGRQRKAFHYQVAHWLCSRYDLVGFEELNIKGLARTRLAKSILDAAWGGFLQTLNAVAVKRGKHTVGVNPRGTSLECSGCGELVRKDLSVRVHRCGCGLVIDRDWNSGINILVRALRAVGLPPSGCRGLGDALPVKQQFSVVRLDAPARTAQG